MFTGLDRQYPEIFCGVNLNLVETLPRADQASGFLWRGLRNVTTPGSRGIGKMAGKTVFRSIPRWQMGQGFEGVGRGDFSGEEGGKWLSLANEA